MALKSGFFDSLNGDRKYNSVQMSQLFDGIINDGVFQNIGGALFVHENEGLNVTVATGRAWFNHTWTYNDSEYDVTLDHSNVVYPRIDTIALKIDSSLETRENSIVVLKGTPGSEPAVPEYIDTEEIHYHPIADIYVGAGVTEIVQANITNRVGTSTTPFVTGILETVDIGELLAQWEAQFTSWNSQKQTEFEDWEDEVQADFEDWFQHLHDELDENQAAHLQNEIDDLMDELTELQYNSLTPAQQANGTMYFVS